jgi:hypothetical protein
MASILGKSNDKNWIKSAHRIEGTEYVIMTTVYYDIEQGTAEHVSSMFNLETDEISILKDKFTIFRP